MKKRISYKLSSLRNESILLGQYLLNQLLRYFATKVLRYFTTQVLHYSGTLLLIFRLITTVLNC